MADKKKADIPEKNFQSKKNNSGKTKSFDKSMLQKKLLIKNKFI